MIGLHIESLPLLTDAKDAYELLLQRIRFKKKTTIDRNVIKELEKREVEVQKVLIQIFNSITELQCFNSSDT